MTKDPCARQVRSADADSSVKARHTSGGLRARRRRHGPGKRGDPGGAGNATPSTVRTGPDTHNQVLFKKDLQLRQIPRRQRGFGDTTGRSRKDTAIGQEDVERPGGEQLRILIRQRRSLKDERV